jgi:excisionase family DNA binding protein
MTAAKTRAEQALSLQHLAEHLSVSVRTAHRLIAGGQLRGHRIGRQWRIFQRDLDDYLAKRASCRR